MINHVNKCATIDFKALEISFPSESRHVGGLAPDSQIPIGVASQKKINSEILDANLIVVQTTSPGPLYFAADQNARNARAEYMP